MTQPQPITVTFKDRDHARDVLYALVAREVRLARKPSTDGVNKMRDVNDANVKAVEKAMGYSL